MPMSPDEVAELSRLLDEAMALEPSLREPWLARAGADQANGGSTPARDAAPGREFRHRSPAEASTASTPTMQSPAPASASAPIGCVREIGRGGMGSVWLAERADGTYKRRVALKLPRLAWAAGLGKRMARERDIGALLEHPNIARLYDAGVDEHGRPYIAMEYIDGQPIDAYCREHALDLRAKLKLFVEVAQAVAYAHGRLVLHRDLKPANVLVDAGGHVHLLDFGIAKLLDDTAGGADLTQEQGRVLTPELRLARADRRSAARRDSGRLFARRDAVRAADRHAAVHAEAQHNGRDGGGHPGRRRPVGQQPRHGQETGSSAQGRP